MKVKLSLSKARHLVTELQRETSSLKHKIFTESVVAVPAYASVFDDDYNKAVQAVADSTAPKSFHCKCEKRCGRPAVRNQCT